MRRLLAAAAFAAILAQIGGAIAQVFPSRSLTLVVPYGAGGPTDTIARIVAEGMRAPLGQPVVIENVAGGSGAIGAGRVARAPADGYVFVIGNVATHALNGALFPLPYDLVGDFAPIALVSSDPLMIVAGKSVPARSLDGFIGWLKANPDKATQGTSGAGGIPTAAGLLFQKQTGTRFRFVPYRGGLAPALLDLVAGQIDFMIDSATNSLPQVRANAIRAFAVAARDRLPDAPDIPSVDEAGLPGFYALNWQALFAPKGTAAEVVTRLNSAAVTALADPTVRRRLAEIGQTVFPRDQQTPAALAAYQAAEIAKWWPLIRTANVK